MGVEDDRLQVIGKPAGGFGTTPLRVTMDLEALLPLVRRLLPELPIRLEHSAELKELFQALQGMEPAPEVRGVLGLTTYLGGDLNDGVQPRRRKSEAKRAKSAGTTC